MATTTFPTAVSARRVASGRWSRLIVPATVLVGLGVVGLLIGREVPDWLDATVRPRVDDLYDWVVLNNDSHWLFTRFFQPIAHTLGSANDFVGWILESLRWPGVLAAAAAIGWRTGGWRAGATGAAALAGCGVLGLWAHTMITLSLMIVAVAVSLAVGIPLGIWAGLSDRTERYLKTFLDAAQVMPAYVYLLPVVVLFGIGGPPAIVATAIFAVAPAVRLTSHGIRSVPVVANEVGESFGCTRTQLLMKVQLPVARRAILLGLNQVIMMAFGVVVISALVGTGGLGNDVLAGLQKVDVGKAFVPGLALVLCAMALDRITTGEREVNRRSDRSAGRVLLGAAGVVLVGGLAKLLGANQFPSALTIDIAGSVTDAVDWVNRNFRNGVPIIGGTGSFSDFLVIHVLTPLRDMLQSAPWWLIVVVAVGAGWASAGPRLGALCGACMVGIASLQVWDLAMDTLSQVLVAVVLSIAIALPIGIWAGRSDRVERILRPFLDAFQVMPQFVYLVPVAFLFNVGRVPGVIASVIYAIPPSIRLTSLGLRQVPMPMREAAISFGATPRQELLKVQLPAATKAIMLGINQTILMVLSMVIVAALIGAGALGLETIYGLTKKEVGRGVAGGMAIVLLAIVLDRLTQAWGNSTGRTTRGKP